ncbi:hypothetical protein HDV63DRAFT_20004 [Trichoderma sp. SZMC 28014]
MRTHRHRDRPNNSPPHHLSTSSTVPLSLLCTSTTSEQGRLTQENWTRAWPGQVGFSSASQPSPGPCQALG